MTRLHQPRALFYMKKLATILIQRFTQLFSSQLIYALTAINAPVNLLPIPEQKIIVSLHLEGRFVNIFGKFNFLLHSFFASIKLPITSDDKKSS